jgi:glucose-1-phosphate cytidylyltransferase
MKAVILAGGLGTRISEESHLKPKPMIEIGGYPILWHIMKIYHAQGINDFIICLGYKGDVIKDFFKNYALYTSDVTFDMKKDKMIVHQQNSEDWRVTLVDTGLNSLTGGRLKRVADYLEDEPFHFTYGDGVADIDIKKLTAFHKKSKKLVTLTAVQPPGRYGAVEMNGAGVVTAFQEKPLGDGAWINGGFFVVNPKAIDYIEDDVTNWEGHTLPLIVKDNQLTAFKHQGFWAAMDTLRDKINLENHWGKGDAPWKVW